MTTKEEFDARIEEARRWVASGDELAVTTSDRVIAALADERDRLAALLVRADDMLRFYNSEKFEHHDRRRWLDDYAKEGI
jgi:hypothetical protein